MKLPLKNQHIPEKWSSVSALQDICNDVEYSRLTTHELERLEERAIGAEKMGEMLTVHSDELRRLHQTLVLSDPKRLKLEILDRLIGSSNLRKAALMANLKNRSPLIKQRIAVTPKNIVVP